MSAASTLRNSMLAEQLALKSKLALMYAASPAQAANMHKLWGGDGRPMTTEEVDATFGPEAAGHYADIQRSMDAFRKATLAAADRASEGRDPRGVKEMT